MPRRTPTVTPRARCIGETVAALEAREMAPLMPDPALGRIMASIADDETRHAALAWRFVQWAMQKEPARVGRVVRRLARDAARELRDAPCESVDGADEPHGLLGAARSLRVRRSALQGVVLPCAQALCATRPVPAGATAPATDASMRRA